MSVKDVVKKTLLKIQREGMTVTPDVYGKAFCIEAKKAGLNLKECYPAEKYIEKLEGKAKQEAKDKKIEQLDDLLTFLIAFHKREQKHSIVIEKQPNNSKRVIKSYNSILTQALEPSFTRNLQERVKTAVEKLNNNTTSLSIMQKVMLEKLIYDRIDLDRDDIYSHTTELENSINHIIQSLATLISVGQSKGGSVRELKEALNNMTKDDFVEEQFEVIKEKLEKVAFSLDEEIETMVSQLEEKRDEVGELQKKVENLQKDLEEAKKESREDFLTKVLTKRALMGELEKLEELYERKKEDYCVVFLDLDHFKGVNDNHGHDAGDLVLKAFAQTIKEAVRKSDFIGRFGGEEFIILLPRYTVREAHNFAERMRKMVEKQKIIYKKKPIKLTVSGGVAKRSEASCENDTLKIADERLYEAKEGGRNKIL
ncbi:MAG: diguanylate cyclase [Campylobacterales bacterium]|nr:diguanylate cyclase [Campylobacterales bacterium]